jgi:hypothetical protein
MPINKKQLLSLSFQVARKLAVMELQNVNVQITIRPMANETFRGFILYFYDMECTTCESLEVYIGDDGQATLKKLHNAFKILRKDSWEEICKFLKED